MTFSRERTKIKPIPAKNEANGKSRLKCKDEKLSMASGSICMNPAPKNIPPAKAFPKTNRRLPLEDITFLMGINPPTSPAVIMKIILRILKANMVMIPSSFYQR